MTRIVQCLSHAVESYDQLKLYTEMGYEAVDIGGYIDPRNPHVPIRPPIPNAPFVPEIKTAIDALDTRDNLRAAQEYIPSAVLEWLGDDGVLIYHHYLDRLYNQWGHIRDWMRGSSGRRVVWRTVGQSVTNNETQAIPYRLEGLEIVRYSPKEWNIPSFAGADALIRFYKDPAEWGGWTGDMAHVVNFTQCLRQREPYTNWKFWDEATKGLPARPYGPGSEEIDGAGETSWTKMRQVLRRARAYLYTGTQPASYTLGLIEAMMTGVPVVSIGPGWMNVFPYGSELFEGHELAGFWSDDPIQARGMLAEILSDEAHAAEISRSQRARAIELFGKQAIAEQWRAFLG